MKNVLRSIYRLLTYSPIELWRQQKLFSATMRKCKGSPIFLFPYIHIGGAERVHARITAAVSDQSPIVIIHGFSTDRSMADQFSGTLLELPHLFNHPFTRKIAIKQLAKVSNSHLKSVVFASLSTVFFDLLPFLHPHVRTYYLQHAFLYQPGANLQHVSWSRHFDRVTGYIFISSHARNEFQKFLLANGRKPHDLQKLELIYNAVEHFQPPIEKKLIGVLFVGRESAEKRIELFLRIASIVGKEMPGVFKFTAVGPRKRDTTSPVKFKGTVSDEASMRSIYADHEILVVTSSREGFPLVIMEAMAHGCTVISTPVGDVPVRISPREGIITSSIEGTVVEQGISSALIQLAKDRDRLWQLRLAAYDLARREFDPEKFRRSYRALLMPRADT